MNLTKEQIELIEKNHNLIYWYASKYEVPVDEYYYNLAIGLCRAAKYYDNTKAAFSNFAITCMKNEMNTCYKSQKVQKRIPKEKIGHYDGLWDVANLLPPCENTENKVISTINFNDKMSKLSKLLTPKEKETLFYLLKGLNMCEIARNKNVSKQSVHQRICNIRKKALSLKIFND